MHEKTPEPDPIDALDPSVEALLAEAGRLPATRPEFRESVFADTELVLRGRRLRRRAGAVAAALLLYAAGAVSGSLLEREIARRPSSGTDGEVAVLALPADPRTIERSLADEPPAERARTWRRVGDGYLTRHADPESALFCYRRLLDVSEGTEALPGDSWLLTYLKVARED